jgi:hypothetical protein
VSAPNLAETALAWAEAGRPVFPVGRDKKPITEHGLLDATTDADRIERFWRAHLETNVAVRTGEPSGLVVLDVDGDDGSDSLFELEREHGELPETTRVTTPRGGQHFYFRWPGFPVKTVAGFRPGLDSRGDGGYVLVPPSRTLDGGYEYDHEAGLADMPPWLVELLVDGRQAGGRVPASASPDEWVWMLRDGIPDGRRNTSLAGLCGFLLRRYIYVDLAAEIVHLVNEHRCRPPKPRGEVDRIIDSIAGIEARRRAR